MIQWQSKLARFLSRNYYGKITIEKIKNLNFGNKTIDA
jgi:hypothetical protein